MNAISITLDLPDKKLHPNGGGRWNTNYIAAIRRSAHKYAWAIAYRDIGKLDWDRVRISYVFYLKNRTGSKLADEDNLVAWMKKYQDGIAEAVGINDKRFTLGSVIVTSDDTLPRVVITLAKVEGGEA